ncbi:MAG: hypothetical protein AAB794_03290 [Patescibacteria group bacterium]
MKSKARKEKTAREGGFFFLQNYARFFAALRFLAAFFFAMVVAN